MNSRRSLTPLLFAGLLAIAAPRGTRAERPVSTDRTDHAHALVIDLKVELPVVIVAAAILGTSQLLQGPYGPSRCRWCDTRASLNAFDATGMRAFEGADRTQAGLGSDLMGYAVMPVATLGLALAASLDASRGASPRDRARRYGIDVLLMSEATATTLSVMQLLKFSTARRRPSSIDEPVDQDRSVDQNLSYFSGHTALAFVLATSAGTISTLRHQRLAPLVWVIGILAATATGMSRVAADQHFASDVLTGSAVGAVIGILVPVLHRVKAPVQISGSASATSGMFALSGAF